MHGDGPVRFLVPRPLPRNRADPVDAGVRPAPGVLFELHPARELSRHRRRLSARRPPAQPVRLVPADPARRDRRGRPPAARGRVPSTSTIYFTSGTAEPVVPVESTLLLPLLFTAVAALFVTVAHRMGRELAGRPPLRAYVINLLGSLAGVAAFALVSWLELPPIVWFGVAAAAALPFVFDGRRLVAAVNIALLAASLVVVYRMQGDSLWSPYYRITALSGQGRHRHRGESHLSPVDGAGHPQGILLPVAVHRLRRFVRRGADPRRRQRHRRRRGAASRRRSTSPPSTSIRSSCGSARSAIRTSRTAIRASPSSPTMRGIS